MLLQHFLNQPFREPHQPSIIRDNLLSATTSQDLPSIPTKNRPPVEHVAEKTPLLIGFTSNWPMLQQAVVSYIVAGWPPKDIYVVDNSGTLLSNRHNLLSIQNPSYLNYSRLQDTLGVNVVTTPTLLSFSQLQNFYLYEALQRNWTHFFWSHMDSVALSTTNADPNAAYQSLYLRAVQDLRSSVALKDWGIKYYTYDRFALVSVAAFVSVGGWDTSIPFYHSDCDVYERLKMNGYHNPSADIGNIFDVGDAMEDLTLLYEAGAPGSVLYDELQRNLTKSMDEKNGMVERNTWQMRQQGGVGEPFYRNQYGEKVVRQLMIFTGRKIFNKKWGTYECELINAGVHREDAWKHRWWIL